MGAEQLTLEGVVEAAVRAQRSSTASSAGARNTGAEEAEAPRQELLFAFKPDIDIHLDSPEFAHATVRGTEPERTAWWLGKIVSNLAQVRPRRFAFPARDLDKLLCVVGPANITLDAASLAVGRAIWADALGWKPLRVTRDGQRLLAHSVRWPTGWKVVDAPWGAIAALERAGVALDIEPRARILLMRRLADSGRAIAVAGLAGSAVRIDTSRPDLIEALELPALSYAAAQGTGRYRIPILGAEPLLREPLIEVGDDVAKAIKKATSKPRAVTGPAGFPWELYAFQARDLGRGLRILEHTGGVLFAGDMGSGKALAADTVVYSPDGPVPIGDLSVGDQVLTSDGSACRVVGVYPQGVRPLYRMGFADGSSIRCDASHLWEVHGNSDNPGCRVLSTSEILSEGLRDDNGRYRHRIRPISAALRFTARNPVPVPARTLGVLLSCETRRTDGGLVLTSATRSGQELLEELTHAIESDPTRGVETFTVSVSGGCCTARISGDITVVADLLDRFRSDGMSVSGSPGRSNYLYGSVATRTELLTGLLTGGGRTPGDAPDGSSSAHLTFESHHTQVVDVVRWLVQSLGGTATAGVATGRPGTWRTTIVVPANAVKVGWTNDTADRNTGRVDAVEPATGPELYREIVAIDSDGRDNAVCIAVDSSDSLFVTEAALLTHNTTVSLAAIANLDCWPILVVAPLAAFSTWARQLGEMGRSYFLATGNVDATRQRVLDGDWDAVVVSYDRLHLLLDELEAAGLGAIVADEIQRIRTPTSRRSRALRSLAGAVPRRIGLSGTPITNRAEDVLPLGAFLVPGEWPPRLRATDVAELYPGEDPVESLAEHLATMMVRRRIDQVGVQLPGRNVKRVEVPLTADQRRALHDMEEEARAAKESGELGGHLHVFARLQKMRQIVNVPHVAGVAGPNPKIAAAVELAQEYSEMGRKSVIFVADRPAWTQVGEALDREGIGWTGIWGSTPVDARIANEKSFHTNDDIRVFVGTLAACAESLTLSPTATVTIFAALSYSPSAIAQAAARAYRMNQTNDVDEIYLHASAPGGTLDDRMFEILEAKRRLIAQVVDRTEHVDGASRVSYADLVFMLTGVRDEVADMAVADMAADEAENERRKAHARATIHRRKTGEFIDDGSAAMTRSEWEALEVEKLDGDLDDEDDWEQLLDEE